MMQNQVKVYWPCYCGDRNLATLSLIEKGRAWEDIWADKRFVGKLSHDDPQTPDSYLLNMELAQGKFTDFAFARIGLLLFNQRVLDAYNGELEKYGKLYPIQCKDAPLPYYYYRITHMVEAMDLAAVSKHDARYQPGETYNSISSTIYEFNSEKIKDLILFKDIQQKPARNTFFGQKFVDIAKKNKFTGLHKDTYKPIWPRRESGESPKGPHVDLASLNL